MTQFFKGRSRLSKSLQCVTTNIGHASVRELKSLFFLLVFILLEIATLFSNELNAQTNLGNCASSLLNLDPPPYIHSVNISPEFPKEGDEVIVLASIANDSVKTSAQTISAWLHYSDDDGKTFYSVKMEKEGDTDSKGRPLWKGKIPSYNSGRTITYYVSAQDDIGNFASETAGMSANSDKPRFNIPVPDEECYEAAGTLDIMGLSLAYDTTFLYGAIKMRDIVSKGTLNPTRINAIIFGFLNPDRGEDITKGVALVWSPLAKEAGGTAYGITSDCFAIDSRIQQTKQPVPNSESGASCSSSGNILYFRLKRSLLGSNPSGIVRIVANTGQIKTLDVSVLTVSPPIPSDATSHIYFYLRGHSYNVKESEDYTPTIAEQHKLNEEYSYDIQESQSTKSKFPPNLFASVEFKDEDGNNFLDADETGKIIVNISNKGEGEAYGVHVMVSGQGQGISELTFNEKTSAVDIKPKEENTVKIPIMANENVQSRQIQFTIKVLEANGFDADPVVLSLETRKLKEPDLRIAEVGMEEIAAVVKNGKIDLGESIDIKVIVQNKGEGAAKDVTANVSVEDSNIFLTSDKSFNLGDIASGDYKEVSFSFTINKRYDGNSTLPISLSLNEKRPKFSKKENLNLALGEQTKTIAEVIVEGKETTTATLKEIPKLSSDVDTVSEIPDFYRDNVYVVAIGISNYKNAEKIPYASKDAMIFADYMEKAGGIPKGRVTLLLDEDAAQGVILGTLKDKLKNATENDTVIIYYAGHGAPDPEGGSEVFLVPYDGKADLPSTLIARSELSKVLGNLKAQNIIFIMDSCFSGKGRSIIAKTGRPFYLSAEGSFFDNMNALVLSATKGNQQSFDYDKGKHGLFTYSLLKAMQGEGDADKDGAVSLKEAFESAKKLTEKIALSELGKDQNPVVLPSEEILSQFSDFIMTRIKP